MPPRLAICRNSSASKTRAPSHPFVPNFGFVRAAVVLRARLLPLAVVALLLGGTAAGGMPVLTEYARTRPDPFLVGISGVLKKTNAAAPRDPSHTAMEWDG